MLMRMKPNGNRKKALLRGKRAEKFAAFWLRLKFYRILARNWRSPFGEADIIAVKGRQLIVVEVKKRRNRQYLDETIRARQKNRLKRAALYFQQKHPLFQDYPIRFDAVLMGGFGVRHIKNAWWDD